MTDVNAPAPLVPDRLASGRVIDLAAPPADYDWRTEIAGPSSRIARFAGQIPEAPYSVAEHECRGADALEAESLQRDRAATTPEALRAAAADALAFLLHDAHETLGGDVKRPFVDLCELLAARTGLAPGGTLRRIIEEAKAALDASLYRAAGLAWPLPPETRRAVADMDERMAAEEMRRFWPAIPLPAHYATRPRVYVEDWDRWPTTADCPPWPHERAAGEWMFRFNTWRRALGGL